MDMSSTGGQEAARPVRYGMTASVRVGESRARHARTNPIKPQDWWDWLVDAAEPLARFRF